ncbi:hypothetical protein [Muricoccus radiodurans]|uniref:hypothetical protein n=1 Tax=Muricoccus radiodurans TaxID=2231721 RepID=UPI003CF6C9E6
MAVLRDDISRNGSRAAGSTVNLSIGSFRAAGTSSRGRIAVHGPATPSGRDHGKSLARQKVRDLELVAVLKFNRPEVSA